MINAWLKQALHEERLMLIDRITKLSSENVNLSAELHKAHQMKRQMHETGTEASSHRMTEKWILLQPVLLLLM